VRIIITTVASAVALLAGWIWGASGRSSVARALQASELRGELRGARADDPSVQDSKARDHASIVTSRNQLILP